MRISLRSRDREMEVATTLRRSEVVPLYGEQTDQEQYQGNAGFSSCEHRDRRRVGGKRRVGGRRIPQICLELGAN